MNRRRVLPFAVLALTFPALLGAGSLIMTQQQARRNSKDRLYLQKGDLRIETEGGQVMIYRSADDAFWLLDPARKTYLDIGARQAAEGEHKTGARADPVPATYRKVASGVEVNGFKADQYDVLQGAEKIAEVWLAAPQAIGLDPADAAGLRLLAKRLGFRAPSYFGFALSESLPEGVPVRTVTYSHGQRISINDFKTVQRQDFPASLFELPPDYKPGAMKP
ncbi:MAG TPA: DUF4412 domain-containing protein [Thermoanaerobaculia bacterium]|jgi:hypothetical protein|nr:DUF4412 domain-containing protein [Thermoanaerobaculia bacterium]